LEKQLRREEPFPKLLMQNPNRAWVSKEIDCLIKEWSEWNTKVQMLCSGEDSNDFDPKTCSEAIKDGWENIRKHEILREKTLVFLRNHFSGTEFILAKCPSHPHEDVTSRLCKKVPQWLHRLEMLKATMDYVIMPDGFWQGQSKKFLEAISKSTAEGAVEVAKSYLKNPFRN